jgi:hypothetical protein
MQVSFWIFWDWFLNNFPKTLVFFGKRCIDCSKKLSENFPKTLVFLVRDVNRLLEKTFEKLLKNETCFNTSLKFIVAW